MILALVAAGSAASAAEPKVVEAELETPFQAIMEPEQTVSLAAAGSRGF